MSLGCCGRLAYCTWYTKANELGKLYGLDLTGTNDTDDFSQQSIKAIMKIIVLKLGERNDRILKNFLSYEPTDYSKQAFECESYLRLIKNSKFWTALAKFRISCHNLEVGRGRHTNPITPLESRLCLICHEIEDEIHFETFWNRASRSPWQSWKQIPNISYTKWNWKIHIHNEKTVMLK